MGRYASVAVVGAVVGSTMTYALVDRPASEVVWIAAALGAILLTATWRSIAA